MAYRIVRNTRQNVLILAVENSGDIIISGNTIGGDGVVSNVAIADVTDAIIGAHIKQLWSSADSSAANGWDILRGANTIWQTDSSTYLDFAGTGCPITLDSSANVVLTCTGSHGSCLIELQKIYETSGAETMTTTY